MYSNPIFFACNRKEWKENHGTKRSRNAINDDTNLEENLAIFT
jgi:hypothetical protein